VALLAVQSRRESVIRAIAFGIALGEFAGTLVLWAQFDPGSADFQMVERVAWIPAFGIDYAVGVDGISLFLVFLTGFLTPLALLSAWQRSRRRSRAFASSCWCSRADDWRVPVARPVPVLRVLGPMIIPMYSSSGCGL